MGITPIPGICGVGQTSPPQPEREVAPALALAGLARMQDDAYQGNQQSAERGMEEEDCKPDENLESDQSLSAEAASSQSLSDKDNPRTALDVFA